MLKRLTFGLLAALVGLWFSLASEQLSAALAQQAGKGISWKHGLNLQVRKFGEKEFTNAPKYGNEIFHDRDLEQLVYINETGTLAVAPASKVPAAGADVAAPKLFHALEVKVRPVGEAKFDKAVGYGIEVFKDPNTDTLLYLSQAASIGALPAGSLTPADKVKDPVWFHGLEVKVRKAGEAEFTDKTKKVSLEVYKDENTGQLVYITDAGQIAVVPAGNASKPSEVKAPTWFAACELKVRKADEKEFSDKTKMYGIEIYKDENAGTLLFVSDAGSIAVVPAGNVNKPASSKDPKWAHGRSFRVRKGNEPDFNDKTQKYGAEVYDDENTGKRIYISETGAIAVLSK